MSMNKIADFECPACNYKNNITIWPTLNATVDPELKEELFSGKLFAKVCPNCGKVNRFNYTLLYHDMTQKVMIKLDTDREQAEWSPKSLLGGFPWFPNGDTVFDGYRFRVVTNVSKLQEKATIFDCVLDDRIIEILKFFNWKKFNEENPNVGLSDIFFNRRSSYIFEFFSNHEKTHSSNLNMEAYELINKKALSAIDYESIDCFFIGQEWARSVVEKYFFKHN